MDGMCSSMDDMDGHTGTYPGEEAGQIPGGAVPGQKIGAEDAGREDSETTVVTPRGDLWGRGGSEITRAAWPQWQCPVPCGQAQHLPKGPRLGYSSHIRLGLFVLLFIISAP